MDGTIEIGSILAIATGITTVCGAILAIKKLNDKAKKERKAEAAAILQSAKENDAKIQAAWAAKRELLYAELDGKIESVKKDLENLRENVEKDMDHMKTTYNGELRNLGDKIEDLRTDLRNQHSQLVELLTAIVSTKD
jgi:predicted RNase H-like nuclease (RuvC/YqgF family)